MSQVKIDLGQVTPVITASKSNNTTTIYADNAPIAQILDGSGTENCLVIQDGLLCVEFEE